MKELNTEYIGLRVTKSTMDKILTCANEDKRSIADRVRLWIEEAVEKRERPIPPPIENNNSQF